MKTLGYLNPESYRGKSNVEKRTVVIEECSKHFKI